ncbi:hypothetical protein FOL47_003158, partial [Perkinsus chesapeaki]
AELAREAARAQALAGFKANNGTAGVSTESAVRLVGPEAWTSSTAKVPTTPLKSSLATEWRPEGKRTPQTTPPSESKGWDTTEKEAESSPWTAPKGGSDQEEMKTDGWGARLRHSAEEKRRSSEGKDNWENWTGWWYDWKWDELKKEWYKEWRKEGDSDENEDDDGWEDGEPVAEYSLYDANDDRHFDGSGGFMEPQRHDRINSAEHYWPLEQSMLSPELWEQFPSRGPSPPSWEDRGENPAFHHYRRGVDNRRMPREPRMREDEWLPIPEPVEEELNYPMQRRPEGSAKGKGRRRRRSVPTKIEEARETESAKRMRPSLSGSPRRGSLDRGSPLQSITYDRPAGHDFNYYARR